MRNPYQLCAVIMLVASSMFASGCSVVTTEKPLAAPEIPDDREKFEGAWQMDEDEIIFVRFASNGVGRIASVDFENDQFRLKQAEFIVAKGEHRNFLSVREQEDDGSWPEMYVFCQYDFADDGSLVIWIPEVSAFEEAIESNALEGDSETTTVTSTPEVMLEFMDDPARKDLFDYEDPGVIRKMLD